MTFGSLDESKDKGEEGSPDSRRTNSNAIKHIGNDEIEQIFFSLKGMNSGKQNFFDFLKKMVHHIHKLVKKERFENDYIEKNFAKLSARELLAAGKTFYMNPCLDFVLVTIEGLKRTGMENVQLIIEELQSQGNVFKLHFGVEVVRKGNNYYIDYRSKNNVFLGKGKFVSKYEDRGESVVHNIKVDAKNISVDDNIYTLVEKGIVTFKNFDPKFLDLIKKKLKNQNSPEQRTGGFVAQVRDIHELEIFVEENQKGIMC